MVEALVNFFRNIIPGELTVFILSMMPIIELRGGLVAAKMLGVDLLPAMLICFIGTILPTPFILLFINKIFDWMRNTRFVKLVDRMEAKGRSKFAQIEKYKTFGLLIFVAIPLPGTGAWTGSLAAALMKMPIKDAPRHAYRGYFNGDFLLRPARHVHLIRKFKWKQKTLSSSAAVQRGLWRRVPPHMF